MKYLITLFIVLIACTKSFAQYPIVIGTMGNDSAIFKIPGAIQSRIINLPYTDTTQANLEHISQYPGAQISVGNKFYVRDQTATKWILGTNIIDSTAYHSIVQAPDSSYYGIRDLTGRTDTIELWGDTSKSINSVVTASNGLTKAESDIQLGGTLTKNTLVDVSTNSYYFGFIGNAGANLAFFNGSSAEAYFSRSGGLTLLAEGGIRGGQLTGSEWGGNFEAASGESVNNGSFGASIGNLSADTTGDVWTSAKFYRSTIQGGMKNILPGYGLINLYSLTTTIPNNLQDTAATIVVKWVDPNKATKTASYAIQTATNGIVSNKFSIDGLGKITFSKYGLGTFTGTLAKRLGVDISGNIIEYDLTMHLTSYTVATLPSSPTQGDEAAVTDATSPAYLGIVTGGGSVYTPVIYNGTNWVCH